MAEEKHPRLKIDETRLDEEWQGHAERAYYWSCRAADAGAVVDAKKARLELLVAQIDVQVRANPESFGIAKVSEKAVQNIIVASDEHQAATRKLIDAKRELTRIKGACDSLRDRKHALQDLVDLHLAGYFGEPRTPRRDWDKKRRGGTGD